MALLPCPECQKDVSDKAIACPHCGMPIRSPGTSWARRMRPTLLGVAIVTAALVVGAWVMLRRSDYARVEELRAEQDATGTRNEHVRQRFFRLYKEHPKNAMYAYLWGRCVDDAAKQLELAEEGIAADPHFSWNYNIGARALARLHRVPQAYDYAVKGSALDPANMQLADKRDALKLILDHKLDDQPRPAPTAYTTYDSKENFEKGAVRYKGLFHGLVRSPERADLQAIERARLSGAKAPVSEAIRGFVVCANSFADACVRVFVPNDARFGTSWPAAGVDVGGLRENQLVAVAGAVIANGRGDNILLADAVTLGETAKPQVPSGAVGAP